MKTVFAFIAAIVLMAFTAQAQSPGVYTQISGGTNNVAAATTNSYATTSINVSEFDNVGIQLSFAGVGAGAGSAVTLVGYRMLADEWDTDNPIVRMAPIGNGTNRVICSTNLSLPSAGAIGHWKIENPDADTAITNVIVKIRMKAPKRTQK